MRLAGALLVLVLLGDVQPSAQGPAATPPQWLVFEFLRIVAEGERLLYLAQPGGAPVTRFPQTSAGPAEIVFENPGHDFPRRIGYRRKGESLVAWVDGGSDGGRRDEVVLQRQRCEP